MKKILLSFYRIPKKIRKSIFFLINYFMLSSGFIVVWEHFFPDRHIFISLFLLVSSVIVFIFLGKYLYQVEKISIAPDVEKASKNLENHYAEMCKILKILAIETAQREQLTDELYQQQHYMLSLIDSIPCYLAVKDKNGVYKVVNRAFAGLLGYEPQEIIGKDVLSVPWEKKDTYHKSDIEIIENGKIEIVTENIRDINGYKFKIVKVKKKFKDGVLVFAINKDCICNK